MSDSQRTLVGPDLLSLITTANNKVDNLQYIFNNHNDVLKSLKSQLINVLSKIKSIPGEVTIRSKVAVDSIADKIDQYRKVMNGSSDSGSKDEMFVVNESHAALLNKLRKENIPLYCILVKSADILYPESLVNTPIPYLKCDSSLEYIKLLEPRRQIMFVANILLVNAYLNKTIQNNFVPSLAQLESLKNRQQVFLNDNEIGQWISNNS